MHYSCNFRCPDCWYTAAGWTELARHNLYKSPIEWGVVWQRLNARYGRCELRIGGGEPLSYPRSSEVIAEVARSHDVRVASNCSMTDAIKEFVYRVDPADAEVDCTFHPSQGDFDSFADNVLLLRRYKFTADVSYLASPQQMPRMAEFKRKFAEKGLDMTIALFQGRHEGRDYPSSYTPEEMRLIQDLSGEAKGPERVAPLAPPIDGMNCGAGWRDAVVRADGRIFRCGHIGHPPGDAVGNICDPNFEFSDTDAPWAAEKPQ